MDELKSTGYETADALDRFRAVRRGQPFNVLWPSDVDEAIEALEDKLNRRPAPENKPLTLEQLRKMDGEPVYLVYPNVPEMDGWQILEGIDQEPDEDGDIGAYFTDDVWESLEGYGNDLLAYNRKPEKEEHHG